MKTLRIVGALFWLGCGWCAGDAACRNARRHLEALEETLLLLQRVRQEIDSLPAARADPSGAGLLYRVLFGHWTGGGRAGMPAADVLSGAVQGIFASGRGTHPPSAGALP